jgi:hypothetical protein
MFVTFSLERKTCLPIGWVTKKFKDNPMAPLVCPANAWLFGYWVKGSRGFFYFVVFRLWVGVSLLFALGLGASIFT